MDNPTNEQLQERCLEFAGIIKHSDRYYELPLEKLGDWERTVGSSVAPSFLTSVDAHNDWTWVELDIRNLGYKLVKVLDYFIFPITDLNDPLNPQIVSGLDKVPALAICKAIWELTEKGK